MVAASSSRVFSAPQLVAAAERNGLRASARLITDWVSLGLIDRPVRRGLGRGRGSSAVWPEAQAQLFVDQLTLRQRHQVTHVASLANLPVLGWLYGHSSVSLRQVRRALATWCGRHRQGSGVSRDSAKRVARQLTASIEHPHTTVRSRAALRRTLEESIRNQTFEREALREALGPVFDPHGEHRSIGPAEAPTTVDQVVRILEARLAAVAALDDLADQDYEDARLIYVTSRADYATKQSALAAHPQTGRFFEKSSFQGLLNSACLDLLTILGMGRLAQNHSRAAATEAPPT